MGKLKFKNRKFKELPNAVFFCVVFFLCADVLAEERKPVLLVDEVVAGSGVGEKDASQLSGRIRVISSKEARNCKVLSTKRTRSIKSRNSGAINACSQSCEVELGRLAEADFVITGFVQATESGASMELKLFSVKSETMISSKSRERYNLVEINDALPSAVSDLISPLKSIVIQATDNEGPTEGPMKNPESVISASESPEDIELPKEEPPPKQWEERKKKEKPSLFDEQESGFLSGALFAGYPFIINRASNIDKAYRSLYHVGLEVGYKVFPFFQIALVGEFQQFMGRGFYSDEFERPDDDATFRTEIFSNISNTWILGFRPTFRFDIIISDIELRAGVGMGFEHFSTSGEWYKMVHDWVPTPDTNIVDDPTIEVRQDVIYSFTQSTSSFYSAFDLAFYYRFQDARYGVGLVASFIVPMMNINDPNPKVRIESDSEAYVDEDIEDLLDEDDYPEELFDPDEEDYRNTVMRHLKAMYLITAGLTLDMRF